MKTSGKNTSRLWLILLVLFGGFAFYLALQTGRYRGGAGETWIFHWVGVVGSGCNALLAFLLNRKGRAAPGAWLVVRYALYVLFFALVLTCLWGQDKPRVAFRALVLAAWFPLLLHRLWSPAGWGRLLRWLDIAFFNLVLFCLLLEGCLRLVGWGHPIPLLSAPNVKATARIQAHRLPPGNPPPGKRANSGGFNDTEFSSAKKEGSLRLLGLSDSFGVESVTYEENYLTRLESALGHPDRAVEVLNLSVNSISPRAYLYLLEEYYAAYQADGAIVCLFVGNDILFLPQNKQRLAFLRPAFWYLGFVPGRLAALVRNREGPGSHKLNRETVSTKGASKEEPTFSEAAFSAIEAKRLPVCLREGRDRTVDRRYGELWGILQKMQAVAGNRLYVVVIPDEFQVNDPLWQKTVADSPLAEKDLDRERPQRAIQAFCKEAGIVCIDLLPALRAAEQKERTYHLRDTHWNRRGHAIAADEIARELGPRLLLRGSRQE